MDASVQSATDTAQLLEQRLTALEAWMPALVMRLRELGDGQSPPEPLSPEAIVDEQSRIDAWLADPQTLSLLNDASLLDQLISLEERLHCTGCTSLEGLNLANIHDLATDFHYYWVLSAGARQAREMDLVCRPTPRFTAPRGLFLFGIGSGRQLQRILEFSQADVVLIFESDFQQLRSALLELDLSTLLPPFSGPGRGLFIITSADPDRAFEEATLLLRQTNLFVLDAMLICDLAATAQAEALRRRFDPERSRMLLGYLGFFADELHMLMNATISFRHLGARVLYPGLIPPHDRHAVITGSGPSLRQHLPRLKAERERYTLFSGWSTLGTLLAAGIVPDFHCPMERHVVHDALASPVIAEALASMALVGPSSLDPRQLSAYAERMLIFRSASVSSAVYGELGEQLIDGEGVLTVNMAALAAVLLGFRRLSFFGADFGAVSQADTRTADALMDTPYVFPDSETGVGGKTVFTDSFMRDGLRALERLLDGWFTPGESVQGYNFSDGLVIKGAPEMDASRFQELLPTGPSRLGYATLAISLPLRGREWAEQRWRLATVRQRCLACLTSLRQLVDPLFEPATLLALTDLCDIYSKTLLDQIPLRLYCGTVFRSWFGLLMLHRRLEFPDQKSESAFLCQCRQILLTMLDGLESLSFELFDYLETLGGLDDFKFETRLR